MLACVRVRKCRLAGQGMGFVVALLHDHELRVILDVFLTLCICLNIKHVLENVMCCSVSMFSIGGNFLKFGKENHHHINSLDTYFRINAESKGISMVNSPLISISMQF